MNTAEINHDLGRTEAQLETLAREMRELKADVRELKEDFAQVKGGWRALIGLSAIIGGAISWAGSHFLDKH